MATKIKNTTTGETIELAVYDYEYGPINYLDDVLGDYEYENSDEGWLLEADEVEFWTIWCERQNRIEEAYAEADDATREAFANTMDDCCGLELEFVQDELENVLGIYD